MTNPMALAATRRSACALLAGALAPIVGTSGAVAAPRTIRGAVSYRERIALPRNAICEISLLDVSLADAPSQTIARTIVRGRQSPIPYRLSYDDRRIRPGRSYALQARISAGGRLLFVTTTRHSVFDGRPLNGNIEVERAARSEAAEPAPFGDWLAEDVGGRGVIDNARTTIELRAEGVVTGSGGCNRFSGRAQLSGTALRFDPMISTRMACAPALMDQERKFLDALAAVRGWRFEREKLALLDGSETRLVLLARIA